jgi:hypothetical protein
MPNWNSSLIDIAVLISAVGDGRRRGPVLVATGDEEVGRREVGVVDVRRLVVVVRALVVCWVERWATVSDDMSDGIMEVVELYGAVVFDGARVIKVVVALRNDTRLVAVAFAVMLEYGMLAVPTRDPMDPNAELDV